MITDTVRPATWRRVVRRRARLALDETSDTVLVDLPPEVRPLVRAFAENLWDGCEIRNTLSLALTSAGLRWYEVERRARELAFSGS